MSISKSFNKKTGVTYVYEVFENYWDKDLKKQVTKRRCIGKIDPDTGEIIPTRTRKKKTDQPEPSPDSSHASALFSPQPDLLRELRQEQHYLESLIQSLDQQISSLDILKTEAAKQLQIITARISSS